MMLGSQLRRFSWYRRLRRRKSFGLNQLDLKLEPYLDFDGGIFVEAGANDGVRQSNTLYFEKYRGWTGLLVEPIPELAERCRKNRPRCIVENVALVPDNYPDATIEMQYCNLMSVVKGAMKTPEEEIQHIRVGCECQKIDSYALRVPTATLTSLLRRHNFTHIDLLSLDVEGYELKALRGLDLEQFRPRFMLIEARYRDEIDRHLEGHYRPVADLSHHDVLYEALR